MKVLLAGANSYIGTRLIPVLIEKGYEVICLCRDKNHFIKNNPHAHAVTVLGGDLLRRGGIDPIPEDINAAFYLVNTFVPTSEFAALRALSAQNFKEIVRETTCRHIVTLSDMNNQAGRKDVEGILAGGNSALTVLNAATIIGPGSTALEMFRALTAKTPMVIPQNWMKTQLQPIAIDDVLGYLGACLLNEITYNKKFDIGGPNVLTFKQMLLFYIAIYLNTKPNIVTLPLLTSQLSSHLLNALVPFNYTEAKSLIENLKRDMICEENAIKNILPLQLLTFKQTLQLASKTPDVKNVLNASLLKSN